MELATFKTILETVGSSGVNQVFLGYQEKPNIEREKLYPFVLWDYNTLTGMIDSRGNKESIKIRAYIVQYYDYISGSDEISIEAVWDDLRAIFLLYLSTIGLNASVQVTNLDKLSYKIFNRGLWIDSEVGISYDVEFKIFC
jgi:hypothetical protein